MTGKLDAEGLLVLVDHDPGRRIRMQAALRAIALKGAASGAPTAEKPWVDLTEPNAPRLYRGLGRTGEPDGLAAKAENLLPAAFRRRKKWKASHILRIAASLEDGAVNVAPNETAIDLRVLYIVPAQPNATARLSLGNFMDQVLVLSRSIRSLVLAIDVDSDADLGFLTPVDPRHAWETFRDQPDLADSLREGPEAMVARADAAWGGALSSICDAPADGIERGAIALLSLGNEVLGLPQPGNFLDLLDLATRARLPRTPPKLI